MRPLLIVTLCVCSLTFSAALAEEPEQQPQSIKLGTHSPQFLLSKITVSDLEKSYDFYTNVIGLKWAVPEGSPTPPPPTAVEPQPEFAEIPMNFTGSLADPFFVLVQKRGVSPTPEAAGMAWVGFKVADARAAIKRVKDAGYEVFREPAEGEADMAFAMAYDPDGYIVEFIQSPDNDSAEE